MIVDFGFLYALSLMQLSPDKKTLFVVSDFRLFSFDRVMQRFDRLFDTLVQDGMVKNHVVSILSISSSQLVCGMRKGKVVLVSQRKGDDGLKWTLPTISVFDPGPRNMHLPVRFIKDLKDGRIACLTSPNEWQEGRIIIIGLVTFTPVKMLRVTERLWNSERNENHRNPYKITAFDILPDGHFLLRREDKKS